MAQPPQRPPEKIACPHCAAMIKSPGLAVGATVHCPKCGKAFRVGEQAVQGPKSKVQGSQTEVAGQVASGRGAESEQGMTNAQAPMTKQIESQKSKIKNPSRPDTLVDPNLLPPPPPREKSKPKEIAVVCKLCGTRSHAPLDRVGQEVKCPDCHSRNVVPPLAGTVAEKKATGPTLDGADEFGMSEVVERPKYRPLVRPAGEYEVLSAVDPATVEHRLSVPDERRTKPRREDAVELKLEGDGEQGTRNRGQEAGQPQTRSRPASRARAVVEPVDDVADAEDDEIVLAPPVEVAEAARDPRSILPQPELEPEDPMYDGRFEGGAIGGGVDPRSPDAWKRAPLIYGIVEFVFSPPTLLRLVVFGVWLALVASLFRLTIHYFQAEGREQILALFILWGGIPVTLTWLFAFAAAMNAVLVGTANGDNEIAWPDWNVFEWLSSVWYVLIGSLVAASPGIAVGALTIAVNWDDPLMAAFGIGAPPLLSWMVLCPVVLYSMLAENSILALLSGSALRHLKWASDGWMFFYMYSIVVVIVGALGVGMLASANMIVSALGGFATVALLTLYFRLLGRLMWYAGQQGEAAERAADAALRGSRLRPSA